MTQMLCAGIPVPAADGGEVWGDAGEGPAVVSGPCRARGSEGCAWGAVLSAGTAQPPGSRPGQALHPATSSAEGACCLLRLLPAESLRPFAQGRGRHKYSPGLWHTCRALFFAWHQPTTTTVVVDYTCCFLGSTCKVPLPELDVSSLHGAWMM